MGVPGNANALLLKSAAVSGGYQVSRSLRFNSGDSAYLNRTPASAGNRQAWTWSAWVKRSTPDTGVRQVLFAAYGAGNDSSYFEFGFDNSANLGKLFWSQWTVDAQSAAVFRDFSAWYHILISYNGSNIVAHVNGTAVLTSAKTGDLAINGAFEHGIGRQPNSGRYFSGYLAECFFIDGQALTPSSFTTTDLTTGQLIPKAYTGSYGTNGFKLNFSDNSTTAALGTDTSGNGNTWTVNNLSVTAGSGNDSLVDTPTSYGTDTGVGGSVRGNYCTLNPLDNSSGMTLANGNLDGSETGGGHKGTRSTIKFPASGKWYYEGTVTTLGGACCIGAATNAAANPDINAAGSYYILVNSSGNVQRYQSFASYTGFDTPAVGTILRVAYDADAQKLWLGLNGLWMNSSTGTTGDPATGANATFSSITDIYPAIDQQTSAVAVNFGQRAFAYTAPSGFKALVDTNLPAPLVAKPNTVMDVVLYTGTGAALTPTSSLGFNPDWIWIKSRSAATDHALYDVVRGAQARLESNTTDAEVTTDGGVTAFNSAGFTLGTLAQVNTSSATYAAWCWDAGTSTVTNTAGSITSQVRANATAGFSVVTYTGTGSNATVGHGLGVAPQMLIVKSRSNAENWCVYHQSVGNTAFLKLDTTGGSASFNAWASTTPTSTVFSVGNIGETNTNGGTYVCYAFAPVSGYSSVSSYLGNGSSDGPLQWCGFRPRFILLKSTSGSRDWLIYDTARGLYNPQAEGPLQPNTSGTPYGFSGYDGIDILSNGFKLRTGINNLNASGETHIFMAFAESPFQFSRAR